MERNYVEDQSNEVEALESIYCDDIEGLHYNQLIDDTLSHSIQQSQHTEIKI